MPRTQTNKTAKNIAFKENKMSANNGMFTKPVSKVAVKILIIIILVYSAIKISAKDPLLYSVLNPETSSDSPSAKSKGVRFVSANTVVNHIKDNGKRITIGQAHWFIKIYLKLKEEITSKNLSKIKAILTS